jgi:hypothetical protein
MEKQITCKACNEELKNKFYCRNKNLEKLKERGG